MIYVIGYVTVVLISLLYLNMFRIVWTYLTPLDRAEVPVMFGLLWVKSVEVTTIRNITNTIVMSLLWPIFLMKVIIYILFAIPLQSTPEDKKWELKISDRILEEELEYAGIWKELHLATSSLLFIRPVLHGNDTTTNNFEKIIELTIVRKVEGFAQFYPIDPKILSIISERIINEIPGISRVAYNINPILDEVLSTIVEN